jgi:hypothetical protein
VTAAGVIFALCLIAHMLVWGFIHFTDVRHQRLEAKEAIEQPLTVVNSKGAVVEVTPPPAEDAVDANTVEGPGSILLGKTSEVVQTVGVISAVVFFVLMFQGVIVAGGGHVPGVEQSVTASTWTLVLMLLALPWGGILPEMVYPGVFRGYEGMVAASAAYRSGAPEAMSGGAFYSINVIIPLLMLAGIGIVIVRFRMGIEQGVIVTHASQLDEKLEREIRERKLGELSQPRAVGALNQAIGLTGGGDRSMQAPMGGIAGIPAPEPVAGPAQHRSPMSSRPSGEEPPPAAAGPPGSPRRPI